MVKFHWTPEVPPAATDPELLEDLGAKWEGDELVTYDLEELLERIELSDSAEFMIDND